VLQERSLDADEERTTILSFLTTAITTLRAAAEPTWTQGTQEQYAQDIRAIRTDISALQRAATMTATAATSGPAPTGPQPSHATYAHVAATIPSIPQAIRATHKPTEVHEITIRIGDAADCEEASKQNS
jgi:hypothetical protein